MPPRSPCWLSTAGGRAAGGKTRALSGQAAALEARRRSRGIAVGAPGHRHRLARAAQLAAQPPMTAETPLPETLPPGTLPPEPGPVAAEPAPGPAPGPAPEPKPGPAPKPESKPAPAPEPEPEPAPPPAAAPPGAERDETAPNGSKRDGREWGAAGRNGPKWRGAATGDITRGVAPGASLARRRFSALGAAPEPLSQHHRPAAAIGRRGRRNPAHLFRLPGRVGRSGGKAGCAARMTCAMTCLG